MSSPSTTQDFFTQVPRIPPDAIFDLTKKFLGDPDPRKVNLGQGTYKDENGAPWILPVVKAAKDKTQDANHEYLPILGLATFRKLATELVLGKDASAIALQRVASSQALSGTGALHLAGEMLFRALGGEAPVYITKPTWSNHRQVFATIGFEVHDFKWYDDNTGQIDFESITNTLRNAPPRSIFVFHASAHNPSGCDPSEEQWRSIARIVQERGLFPLFDAAYLGITSGDYDRDAFAIRHFINECGLQAAVCSSFAKNMGLYGERIGLVTFVTQSSDEAMAVESTLEQITRGEISNPPAFGARIVSAVLEDESLRAEWARNLSTMSTRIADMRKDLFNALIKLHAPGDWRRVVEQRGMFCILGLSLEQVLHLREKYHIYMADTSRISIAGLNPSNVWYTAEAITKTVQDKNLGRINYK
ncbi:putative aspartate aminotransferase [Cucurbitaria berberidis CBS 394.84]|uniref:Aspartate aminotransferase n=1 Tax=Cucurbitaria berberidis CBS 394.84 TaxID=1168544 RepID=A0A9P4GH87_9PLEO|nr:putative aspartate aminotransferase [Cucurbitaria berberidis CBS 394.84]KAF1845292.1 putative aspartate aminotransferase [Cucurbitaria berberidis CBS 394.84]